MACRRRVPSVGADPVVTKRRHDREVTTVQRRLARDADSCIVTVRAPDGRMHSRVGYGVSLPQRYVAAVAQLPAGEYVCVSVSTPPSVYGDISGRDTPPGWHPHARLRPGFARYAGKRVVCAGRALRGEEA